MSANDNKSQFLKANHDYKYGFQHGVLQLAHTEQQAIKGP